MKLSATWLVMADSILPWSNDSFSASFLATAWACGESPWMSEKKEKKLLEISYVLIALTGYYTLNQKLTGVFALSQNYQHLEKW